VCLIRWEEDELQVQHELRRLDHKFQDYGFRTNFWHIPTRDSQLELMSNAIDIIRASDSDQNLFIVYYAGHGRINEARQAEWTCKGRDPNYASVDWSAIQSLFAKARSDILILLDTCAAASSTMRSQYGVMEAIVACGFESKAPPPGEHSFTNTLIEVLDDWINKPSFSASCLHAEILFQLKLKENKKGREGIKLEWCVTPIHINYTRDSKAPGIELCRRNMLPPPPAIDNPALALKQSTFVDAMDIDFDESHTAPTSLSSLSPIGEFQTPHVLIKVGLERNQPEMDVKQCVRWLEGIPLLAKWAKIEGVYPSYSDLLILSIPVAIWDMLPDHPACSFIGYVTAPNLIGKMKETDEIPAASDTASVRENQIKEKQMYFKFNSSAPNEADLQLAQLPRHWNDAPCLPYITQTQLQPPTANEAIMKWNGNADTISIASRVASWGTCRGDQLDFDESDDLDVRGNKLVRIVARLKGGLAGTVQNRPSYPVLGQKNIFDQGLERLTNIFHRRPDVEDDITDSGYCPSSATKR
jgi:hypothetical protein